jgi:SEC-C motif
MTLPICYLCGEPIEQDDQNSGDHRIPRVLLGGAQPKRPGFDFAGKAPSHQACNNGFRDESVCLAALRILKGLHNPDSMLIRQNRYDPSIEVQFLDSSYFMGLSARDLDYFKIFDGRDLGGLPQADHFLGKQKTNLRREATPVVLSVLAKSAAALLISRHGVAVPARWRIWAAGYTADSSLIQDLRKLPEATRPFGDEVDVWIANRNGDFEVFYHAHGVVVYLWFDFEGGAALEALVERKYADTDRWLFDAEKLTHLLGHIWQRFPATEEPINSSNSIGNADSTLRRNQECPCGSRRRYKHCHGLL